MKKFIAITLLCVALSTSVVKASDKIQLNKDDTAEFIAHGKKGTVKQNTGGDSTNKKKSNTSQKITETQKDASAKLGNSRGKLKIICDRIVNEGIPTAGFTFGSTDDTATLMLENIHKSEVAELLNMGQDFSETMNRSDDVSSYNNSGGAAKEKLEPVKIDYGKENDEYTQDTDKVKPAEPDPEKDQATVERAKEKAIKAAHGNWRGGKVTPGTSYNTNVHGIGSSNGGITTSASITVLDGTSTIVPTYTEIPVIIPEGATPPSPVVNPNTLKVRPDLYDADTDITEGGNTTEDGRRVLDYSNRFTPIKNMAISEGWDFVQEDGVTRYRYNRTIPGGGASNSFNDTVTFGVLKDIHISNIAYNRIKLLDFTSNKRKWYIYKDGKLIDTIVTNNPRHELSTSKITQEAGDYTVVAKQLAKVQFYTEVGFLEADYLFDVKTGALLYFSESKGNKINMDSVVANNVWYPTGDEFIVTVNDLGNIETDSNSIKRED